MNPFSLSIVIPVYNESASIAQVVDKLKTYLRGLPTLTFEIICVNDCSTDNSAEVLARIPDIRVVQHLRNRGYGAALKSGINSSTFSNILIMDSDGQHNPQDIQTLIENYQQGFQMVVGARKVTQTKKRRVLGKIFLHKIANYLFGHRIPDLNSGFRLFNKELAQKYFHMCSNRFSFTTSLTLAFLSEELDVKYTPIQVAPRSTGKSHVNMKAGLRTLLKIIQIAMIFKPLRVLLPISFVFTLAGITTFVFDILEQNISDTTVLLFVTSVILFVFAMVSDQLSNIQREIRG